MSNLTANNTRGLMEAYAAVYDSELRENLEEQRLIEDLGFEIIENAAHVLFSQGYTVEDLCDYFEEASTEVITEDFVGFTEGKAYLSESLIAPQQHIEEQFRQLNEVAGLVRGAINLGSKIFGAGAGAMKGGGGAKAALGAMTKSAGRSLKQGLQSAGQFAKTKMGQVGTALKGAVKAAPTALKGAVKGAAKIGGRALPGVGAALYGMDAANRFKKGDWGGGLLSTAGAVTSLVPGAGLVAGLAPAGIQMATDAMGLTGDKSKKGPSVKSAPAAPKPPKGAGMVNVPGKGQRYYASSDKKYYKNYNDALAARNSRLGLSGSKPAAPAAPAAAAPSANVKASPAPAAKPPSQLSPGGRKGNEELEGKTFPTGKTKGGTEYEVRTPTRAEMEASKKAGGGEAGVKAAVERGSKLMGGPEGPGKIDPKSVEADLKAQQEKEKKKPQTVNASYEYDAYDIVLEYLVSGGHVESVSEAHYVMLEMDAKTIQSIVEETTTERLAALASKKADDPGAKSEYKPEGPRLKNPRSKAAIMNQIAGRARTRAQDGADSQYASQDEQPRRGGRKGRGSKTDRPATANMPNPNRKPKG